jgi:hypothetical protein
VKDDLRRLPGKNLSDRPLVLDVGQGREAAEVGMRALQFHFDVIERAFALIEQNQPRRTISGDLAAELSADRAARAGDQHSFSLQQLLHRR